MCLSKAYVDRNGRRELLIEEVASVKFEGARVLLRTLFGEEKEVGASIKEIDFLTHSIFLENLKDGDVLSKDK